MAAACYKKQQAFLADSQVIYNNWLFLSIIYNQTVNAAFNQACTQGGFGGFGRTALKK